MADHGEQLGEDSKRGHGLNLDDAVVRVPLIIRRPGQAAGIIDEPFSLDHLRDLLVSRTLPSRSPYVRAHLVPPHLLDVAYGSIQRNDWKLVEITQGSGRQELLFQVPDESTNRARQVPAIADDLRARLGGSVAADAPRLRRRDSREASEPGLPEVIACGCKVSRPRLFCGD